MAHDDPKRNRDVRPGVLMIAAVATFLSLSGCDSRTSGLYPPWKTDEGQEQQDQRGTGSAYHGGYSGVTGGRGFGPLTGSSGQADSAAGTVRGGFGQTGAMHASST